MHFATLDTTIDDSHNTVPTSIVCPSEHRHIKIKHVPNFKNTIPA